MRWTILSLFPEMFVPVQTSILGRATKAGKLQIEVVNFRDYSTDKHRKVDDLSYSPGAGMVLSCQPIFDCLQAIDPEHKAHRVFMTPAAPILNQERVVALAQYDHIIILCGHYEGVDQRVIDECFDEVISIGRFVLTGGEIPAMVLVDSVSRYVAGVINKDSLISESYTDGKLEHPQYTRPRVWRGVSVPEVLLSGNHAAIQKWKDEASRKMTEKFLPH
ncbi:MAG: tRNA (guanosine(37)-N1)-methyltransferase TrmD [Clostridia bacterium]|nr:tRNA (guanosine(37)-N1)-methyltransferase TrmD [Clostridia bacterium]